MRKAVTDDGTLKYQFPFNSNQQSSPGIILRSATDGKII